MYFIINTTESICPILHAVISCVSLLVLLSSEQSVNSNFSPPSSIFRSELGNYRWLNLSLSVPNTLKVAEPTQECMFNLFDPFCEFAVTSRKRVILCRI